MSQDMGAPFPEEDADEVAASWCLSLSEGELSEADWSAFEAWLEKPGHADLFQDAAAVWQSSGAAGDWPQVIALRTRALTRFRRAGQHGWWRVSLPRLRSAVGYAAALLILVAVTFTWYGNRPVAYATGIGERQVALLDDGSRVSLDAVTNVKIRMKDESRRVELVGGRAKFDVAKDPLRPFTVAAGDKLIVAVGTSFSVELVGGDVRVILYEGQVEVRDRSDTMPSADAAARRLRMVPGSELVGSVGSGRLAAITHPDLSQSLSWEQGLINLEGEPLASAVERMNRYSTTRIRLSDPALGSIAIDGVYKAGDVEGFVEGVAALHPVKPKMVGGDVVLEGK